VRNIIWFAICVISFFAALTISTIYSGQSFMNGYKYGFDDGVNVVKKNIDYLASKPWKKKGFIKHEGE